MSSAKKHKQRSHRSYRNNVATAEHFQNKQILKVSQQKVMKEKSMLYPMSCHTFPALENTQVAIPPMQKHSG